LKKSTLYLPLKIKLRFEGWLFWNPSKDEYQILGETFEIKDVEEHI
jgi:hypothetical protein